MNLIELCHILEVYVVFSFVLRDFREDSYYICLSGRNLLNYIYVERIVGKYICKQKKDEAYASPLSTSFNSSDIVGSL